MYVSIHACMRACTHTAYIHTYIHTLHTGAPGLGIQGTPEAQARGKLFGEESIGTRQQARRDRDEQVLKYLCICVCMFVLLRGREGEGERESVCV